MRAGPAVEARLVGAIPAVVVRRDATLANVARATPRFVRSSARGVWTVNRTIFVVNGATLSVSTPAVRQLRLASTARRFASIMAVDANLMFSGGHHRLRVTSWDPWRSAPDKLVGDGRASISVAGRGRLDAADVTFSDLGWSGSRQGRMLGRVSGVAISTGYPVPDGARPEGTVVRSTFLRNYFGAYTHNARAMRWLGNRFVHNRVYGFDPHTHSTEFLVEDNYAAYNGHHGIIFSLLCHDNVIRGNVTEYNGWHGIVIDDGKFNNGPSLRNLVAGNTVRHNGRVGVSVDGSEDTTIRHNRILGGRYGIRVLRAGKRTLIEDNAIVDVSDYGVYVDGPDRPRPGWAQATTLRRNRISGAEIGVRLRHSLGALVQDTTIERVHSHGIKVDGRVDPASLLAGNHIAGSGTSPVWVSEGHTTRQVANQVDWNYPFAHDVARVAAWVVGPSLWILIGLVAGAGPLVLRAIGRAPRRPQAAAAQAAGGALPAQSYGVPIAAWLAAITVGVAAVVIAGRGDGAATREPVPATAGSSALAPLGDALGPAIAARSVVAKNGHATHPTWYHDQQVVERDGVITVAYNSDGAVYAAQLRSSDLRVLSRAKISVAGLGGSTDSTGTDTNRHDVPTVVSDSRGFLHFFYGGGSLAARLRPGPLHRRSARRNSLAVLGRERPLRIGGGSAFDFEAARDSAGVTHLVGQRSRRLTGSLIELRLLPNGRLAPARQIVTAGSSRTPCTPGRSRPCLRFAIARLAASPSGRELHLVWGNSRGSLSDRCLSGSCHSNLYYARSADYGATWTNAGGTARVRIGDRSIADTDRRFRVLSGAVSLFKAIALNRAGRPVIVYSAGPPAATSLYALEQTQRGWRRHVIADAGDDSSNWSLAPTVRFTPSRIVIWVATGKRIVRFSSTDGRVWRREVVHRGPAFSMTGGPSTSAGDQLLVWRGKTEGGRSEVMLGRAPLGP